MTKFLQTRYFKRLKNRLIPFWGESRGTPAVIQIYDLNNDMPQLCIVAVTDEPVNNISNLCRVISPVLNAKEL